MNKKNCQINKRNQGIQWNENIHWHISLLKTTSLTTAKRFFLIFQTFWTYIQFQDYNEENISLMKNNM